MENKNMEDIKIKKEKMRKIIKEVKWEFPDDFALQQVHIARKVLAEEAKEKGMSFEEYVNWKYKKIMQEKDNEDNEKDKDNEKDNE